MVPRIWELEASGMEELCGERQCIFRVRHLLQNRHHLHSEQPYRRYKAAMAGTAVFLGFTPTMITLVGSVVSDLGRLSTERPILSTLCACSMIGFSFTRSFEPFNIDLNLNHIPTERSNLHIKDRLYKKSSDTIALKWSISCIQYVLATAAVVNTIHNAYEVGLRSVVSFSCRGSYFLPLLWYCLTPAIQVLILFLVRIVFQEPQYENPNVAGEKRSRQSSIMRSLQVWIRSEALLCSARNPVSHKAPTIRPGGWREGLSLIVPWAITAVLVAQFALGTVVMGSIIFVRTQDATVIVIRFLLSVLLVRCIVAFEVEGMRYAGHLPRDSPLSSVLPDESANLCPRDATAQDIQSANPIESSSTTKPD